MTEWVNLALLSAEQVFHLTTTTHLSWMKHFYRGTSTHWQINKAIITIKKKSLKYKLRADSLTITHSLKEVIWDAIASEQVMLETYLRLGGSQAGVRAGGGQVVPQLVRGRRGGAAPGGRVALRVEASEHHRCSRERERETETAERSGSKVFFRGEWVAWFKSWESLSQSR